MNTQKFKLTFVEAYRQISDSVTDYSFSINDGESDVEVRVDSTDKTSRQISFTATGKPITRSILSAAIDAAVAIDSKPSAAL